MFGRSSRYNGSKDCDEGGTWSQGEESSKERTYEAKDANGVYRSEWLGDPHVDAYFCHGLSKSKALDLPPFSRVDLDLYERKVRSNMAKRAYILSFVVLVTCAISAMTMAGASAAIVLPAEWLANGKPIFAALASERSGEFLFVDMNATGGAVEAICDAVDIGTAGPGGAGSITEIIGLEGKKITKANEGTAFISCKFGPHQGVCSGKEVKVKPLHAPWSAEVWLVEFGGGHTYFWNTITNATGNPGYGMECNTIIGTFSDECTGDTGALASNGTGGEVISEFVDGHSGFTEEEELGLTPAGNCALGGAKEFLLSSEAPSKLTLINKEALTTSE